MEKLLDALIAVSSILSSIFYAIVLRTANLDNTKHVFRHRHGV